MFIPSQRITYLRYVLDSIVMCAYLTTEKADKLKLACEGIMSSPNPTIREVASLLAHITASFPTVITTIL